MFHCGKRTKQANPNVECCCKSSDEKVPVLCFCILAMLKLSLFTHQFIPCGYIFFAPKILSLILVCAKGYACWCELKLSALFAFLSCVYRHSDLGPNCQLDSHLDLHLNLD